MCKSWSGRVIRPGRWPPGTKRSEVLAAEPPALMLLDYNLSDMTADQLIKQLAGDGVEVPFIVFTGRGASRSPSR